MVAIQLTGGAGEDPVAVAVEEVRRETASRGRPLGPASVQEITERVGVPVSDRRRLVRALIGGGLAPALHVVEAPGAIDRPPEATRHEERSDAEPVSVAKPSRPSARTPSELMHHHRLLTAAEEYELGRRIADGQLVRQAIEDGFAIPPHRRATVKRQLREADEAAEELMLCNIRLVAAVAKRYERSLAKTDGLLDYDDLLTEGILGLHRAIEKWDHTRELKFSTYAMWWIRQSIQRAVDNHSRTIRLPVHVHEDLRRLRHAQRELESQRQAVAPERLAQELGWRSDKVIGLLPLLQLKRSLDQPIGEDGARLGELLTDPELEDPEDHALLVDLERAVREALAELSDRERDVVICRLGLFGYERMTLEEIGQDFGVTRERIRQIEAKALEKLRSALFRSGFAPERRRTEEGEL